MGHDHHHNHTGNETRLLLGAAFTGAFMLVEVVGGIMAHSLALVADAGHMLTDFAALGVAWYAFRLKRRPADWKRTYGFDRFQVLVAFANGLALFAIAGWIVVEAVQRLLDPPAVDGPIMIAVAVAGLLVNIVVFAILHGGDRRSLNMRGAALHVLGDLLGSVAALAAGLIIARTGWTPADPILSVVVAAIILRGAWRVVAEAGHILLEGAPEEIDTRNIAPDLIENIAGLTAVEHIHIWSITEDRPMATLHVKTEPSCDIPPLKAAIRARLESRFGLDHVTLEIDTTGGAAA